MQLVVDKIARSFGINEIFKDISFMIDKGEKIGLVGVTTYQPSNYKGEVKWQLQQIKLKQL